MNEAEREKMKCFWFLTRSETADVLIEENSWVCGDGWKERWMAEEEMCESVCGGEGDEAMSGCERRLVFTASAVKLRTDQGETGAGIRNGQSIRQMDFEVRAT